MATDAQRITTSKYLPYLMYCGMISMARFRETTKTEDAAFLLAANKWYGPEGGKIILGQIDRDKRTGGSFDGYPQDARDFQAEVSRLGFDVEILKEPPDQEYRVTMEQHLKEEHDGRSATARDTDSDQDVS